MEQHQDSNKPAQNFWVIKVAVVVPFLKSCALKCFKIATFSYY